MKIYTSYFARARQLTAKGIVPVSIAQKPPHWYYGARTLTVAPTPSILYTTKSDEEYTRRFKTEVLGHADARRFADELKELSGGKDVALCCYEKPTEFCHRQLVAEWLREELGEDVTEWGVSRNPVYTEGKLF